MVEDIPVCVLWGSETVHVRRLMEHAGAVHLRRPLSDAELEEFVQRCAIVVHPVDAAELCDVRRLLRAGAFLLHPKGASLPMELVQYADMMDCDRLITRFIDRRRLRNEFRERARRANA